MVIFTERERERERERWWKGVSFNMTRHQIIYFDLVFWVGARNIYRMTSYVVFIFLILLHQIVFLFFIKESSILAFS